MATVYLFVYGKLKPEYEPPVTMTDSFPDQVYGDLYTLGNDAALVDLDKSKKLANGYTLCLDNSEMKQLDKEESPEYRRALTKTKLGYPAFIYEYVDPLPKHAKAVKIWKEKK